MKLPVWLGGQPAAQVDMPPDDIGARTPRDKVAFHMARFTRAIEQCEKPERLHELKANLAYWTAIDRANRAKGRVR